MGNSQSFEGVAISIKVESQTLAHIIKQGETQGQSRGAVAREWLNHWRTLAGLPLQLYQRLLWAAKTRRVPLAVLVNEALVKYCLSLDEPPSKAGRIETPLDILDEETFLSALDEKPDARGNKRR